MVNHNLNEGDTVKISGTGRNGSGEILTRFIQEISLEIDGQTTRVEATEERPAYLIKLDEGKHVIKYADEIGG